MTSDLAIVYAGPHYGRPHRVLHNDGRRVTVVHGPSGEVLTLPLCDVELLPNTAVPPLGVQQ